MAEPLPELAIKLENGDVGEIFKTKINQLIDELNLNRTEFNKQLSEAGLAEDFANASKDYRNAAGEHVTEAQRIADLHLLAAQAITETGLPLQLHKAGMALFSDGTKTEWQAVFPAQDGVAGKALFTDGTNISWMEVLPVQTGHKHKRLVTNGAQASWQFEGEFTRDEIGDHDLVAGDRAFVIATDTLVQASLPATIKKGQPFTVRNSLKSNSQVRVVNPNFTLYDRNQDYQPGDNPLLVPGEQISLRALSDTELEIL